MITVQPSDSTGSPDPGTKTPRSRPENGASWVGWSALDQADGCPPGQQCADDLFGREQCRRSAGDRVVGTRDDRDLAPGPRVLTAGPTACPRVTPTGAERAGLVACSARE